MADLDVSTHLFAISISLPLYHYSSVGKGYLTAHVNVFVDLAKMIKPWFNLNRENTLNQTKELLF